MTRPDAPYGCLETSHRCAIYYPTPTWAATTLASSTATATPTTKEALAASFGLTLTVTVATPVKSIRRRNDKPSPAPALVTPPPFSNPAVLCCDAANNDCIIQPTACVDNFEHPWTALCLGACRDDPMTLKCVENELQHCNQVNFESPLMYLNNSQIQMDPANPERAVAKGLVRGWFCGPTPVPTHFRSWSPSRTTGTASTSTTNKLSWINPDGNASNTDVSHEGSFTSTLHDAPFVVFSKPGQSAKLSTSGISSATSFAAQQSNAETTNKTGQNSTQEIPSLTSGFDKPQPSQTIASPTASPGTNQPGQSQGADEFECDFEWELDGEADAGLSGNDNCDMGDCVFELDDSCTESCDSQPLRRAVGQGKPHGMPRTLQVKRKLSTNAVTPVTETDPMMTAIPTLKPIMAIAEGVHIISTAFEEQSRPPLLQATRSWNVVTPTQNVTLPQFTGGPKTENTARHGHGTPQIFPQATAKKINGMLVGGAVGGILGALLLVGAV